MLKSLIFFGRFIIFWLLFFLLDRLIFLCSYLEDIPKKSFSESIAVFYHGLRLDIAMAGYLLVIPLLFILPFLFLPTRKIDLKWLKVYNSFFVVLFSIISIINLNIYREWGTKFNAKALGFAFSAPNEAMASSASSPIVLNILLLGLLIALGLFLRKLLVPNEITLKRSSLPLTVAFCILLPGINFLMLRGGFGVSPNNQSMAYYSDQQILNHAAVNTEWNLISDLLKSRHADSEHYHFMPDAVAAARIRDLYHTEQDSTTQILNTKQPNVVVIIMESFTADLTKTLGNETGVTPKFDSLIKQGVLFSKVYSTGNRTDKGILGTLTGYPSMAAESMVKWPERMEKLPALSTEFHKRGYKTSFFYGGQSEFDNYKAFILSHDYDLLVDKSSFSGAEMNSKWGAYDGVVFNRQLQELNKTKEPFFSTQMTLTNHEPFEVPGKYHFGNADNVQKFKSTAFYADSCLNDFLNRARQQPWYKNTLFVFVADHGHILPKGRNEVYIPQRYHIPLLFFGDVIKDEYRGKAIDKVGSQIDIASTLLHQLNISTKAFNWSKNLLNPTTKPFAFFSWDNGMGFIDNKQCVTFDNVGEMVLYDNLPADKKNTAQLLQSGKAYLQAAYQQFLSL